MTVGVSVGPVSPESRTDWRDEAECLEADGSRFDDPHSANPPRWRLEAAEATIAAYCSPCPVKAICDAEGRLRKMAGIWGGNLYVHERGDQSPRIVLETRNGFVETRRKATELSAISGRIQGDIGDAAETRISTASSRHPGWKVLALTHDTPEVHRPISRA